MNQDLNNLNDWFKANKLSLNVNKTNYIKFTNNLNEPNIDQLKIKINNEEITQVQNTKFLGVIIDDKLTWKEHISKLGNKISAINYNLRLAKNTLNKTNLKTLYQTLIQSQLEYGINLWGGTNQTTLKRLEITQKKSIRIINKVKYNEPTKQLFKTNKLLKLNDLYKLNIAKFMYKATNNLLPNKLKLMYKPNNIMYDYNTRHAGNFHIRYRRTKLASLQINHQGPKIWQEIPNPLKNNKTEIGLKINLKKHIINNYEA